MEPVTRDNKVWLAIGIATMLVGLLVLYRVSHKPKENKSNDSPTVQYS